MIRTLHIIDHLGLGGAQSALLDLVCSANPASLHVEVAVMHGRGMFAEELEARGIKVHSLAPGRWPPVYLPSLVRLLRSGRYDILHFHLQGANWLAKPLSAFFSGGKRVAHDHSSADLRFRKWWSLFPDAFTHLFSSRVIAVSDGVADFLASKALVPRRKISVVANGVDTHFFGRATPQAKEEARAVLGLTGTKPVVGALGRLAPEKNFSSVVALARKMPELDFVLGGSGPEREALINAAAGLENFRLLGDVFDRRSFYAALDVFVLPSLHEALPMTLLEAMAAGVPVVASELEGVSSALGETGLLVPPGDLTALESALRSLAADPEKASRLASAARERVVDHYEARLVAARVENVYRQLLA